MRYSDLIEFDPIETVIQLTEVDAEDKARILVSTYVISKRMADQLINLVFPQLQYDSPSDNKGLLILGNYGTGKSHLMALISAIAERAELADLLTNSDVADAAAQIAGRFKVIRSEIGGVEMSLRDIVGAELTSHLSTMGVEFDFLAATRNRTTNKDVFVEMMAAFTAVHPHQGLLLVIDELLDFLRTREERALILDLNFLREIGEVCKNTRFRFVSGVQETLFDNPRFQFVAETLRRVKDRFEQVGIAREDIAYVVGNRLLRKDDTQRSRIREHLEPFGPLYGELSDRLDEFVELFPIHPAYLDIFERVFVAEKREILKTISSEITRLLDRDVPSDEPGLIAYDSYWSTLKENPALRSLEDVKRVIDKSDVLISKIATGYTRPQYKDAAVRIIHALSVHRLTTTDIEAPIGVTAEELRDDLTLILPVPEKDPIFLKNVVETALNEIMKTVSGQFLNRNVENGQWFLDLKKTVDFDSLIEKKADGLSDDQLDRYYFDALVGVLEMSESTDVPGFKIWQHELEWRSHRAGRLGYLFFGAPNERSTAQPPRDFYVYFLQPFDAPKFTDEQRGDEVFFRLVDRDDNFNHSLRRYAGAREMAQTAGQNRSDYEAKAAGYRRALTSWLRDHIMTAFEVTHRGRTERFAAAVQGKTGSVTTQGNVRDIVNAAAATLLEDHFADQSPNYPTFSVLITGRNREQATQEALRWIAGGVKSKQGAALLDALELLDGDRLTPRTSRYGQSILDQMSAKDPGQVVNRSELISEEAGGIEYWSAFRLETEFLAVVLAALVHDGLIVLSLAGSKFDASMLDTLAKTPVIEVANFKHLAPPKDLPADALQTLFDELRIPRGLIANPSTHDEAVQKLQEAVVDQVAKTVEAQQRLEQGLSFWGFSIMGDDESAAAKSALRDAKDFLETLQRFNSPGKLKNFPFATPSAVKERTELLRMVQKVADISDEAVRVAEITTYLTTAEAILPSDSSVRGAIRDARADATQRVLMANDHAAEILEIKAELERIRSEYVIAYSDLHRRARLGPADDERKARLTRDPRLKQLQALRNNVPMMPNQQLREIEDDRLGRLRTCMSYTAGKLASSAVCVDCQYRPSEEATIGDAALTLDHVDRQLDALLESWTKKLVENLHDPTVDLDLISAASGRAEVERFQTIGRLPDDLTSSFLKSLNEALSGLERVAVSQSQVHAALTEGGLPCTVDEFRKRFDIFMATLSKGRDTAKIRIVIEGSDGE